MGRAPGDREMVGHAQRYRAEPLGFSGEADVGPPFEQDADCDLTVEAGTWRAETAAVATTRRRTTDRQVIAGRPAQSGGTMLALRWNTLSGSYFALICWSLAYLAP